MVRMIKRLNKKKKRDNLLRNKRQLNKRNKDKIDPYT